MVVVSASELKDWTAACSEWYEEIRVERLYAYESRGVISRTVMCGLRARGIRTKMMWDVWDMWAD